MKVFDFVIDSQCSSLRVNLPLKPLFVFTTVNVNKQRKRIASSETVINQCPVLCTSGIG